MPTSEGVGRITPLVIGDEATVQEFEIMITVAQGDRTGVTQGVRREEIPQVQLRVEANELQFIHVTIIQRIRAVVTMRVLELDGEAERIDEIVNA
jgi:hypothetical protein